MPYTILAVDDEHHILDMLKDLLEQNGYDVLTALHADSAVKQLEKQPDLILLDVNMPEVDGFEFAETVRELNKTIPILFMTARDDITSKQKGFQLGIDDYMVKPINFDELIMRVGALLRRANIIEEKKMVVGNLSMDADAMTAMIAGEELTLTLREFNILYKMLSYPNKTLTRAQLMDEFWGVDSDTSLRAVDVYVTKLREKLSECDGFQIITVRGLGYKAVLQ